MGPRTTCPLRTVKKLYFKVTLRKWVGEEGEKKKSEVGVYNSM